MAQLLRVGQAGGHAGHARADVAFSGALAVDDDLDLGCAGRHWGREERPRSPRRGIETPGTIKGPQLRDGGAGPDEAEPLGLGSLEG